MRRFRKNDVARIRSCTRLLDLADALDVDSEQIAEIVGKRPSTVQTWRRGGIPKLVPEDLEAARDLLEEVYLDGASRNGVAKGDDGIRHRFVTGLSDVRLRNLKREVLRESERRVMANGRSESARGPGRI